MINDIRLTSSNLYGLKALDNMQTKTKNESAENFKLENKPDYKKEENTNKDKINMNTLGAPAGFFADISMLNEEDARKIGLIQL